MVKVKDGQNKNTICPRIFDYRVINLNRNNDSSNGTFPYKTHIPNSSSDYLALKMGGGKGKKN